MVRPQPKLERITEELAQFHGEPPPPRSRDPYHLALWECCAYLVDDDRRRKVFDRLRRGIGLDPHSILSSDDTELQDALLEGGMHPERRAEKVRTCARIAEDVGVDELRKLVRKSPDDARKVLRRFPGIGEPGAEKILLFSGGVASLGVDSNGLRVLVRLGYGDESSNYTRMYRSAMSAVAPELPGEAAASARIHKLLRVHGKETCRRSRPACKTGPIRRSCEYFLDAPA